MSNYNPQNTPPIARILWADDEIDLLKPHIMFLQNKGYRVTPVTSGHDALKAVSNTSTKPDIIFLDENMPGLSGLTTLEQLKTIAPSIPVVLITKNDDEHIMDLALGNRIADYLIKPVNPHQILLSIKKVLHTTQLIADTDTRQARNRYMAHSDAIDTADNIDSWQQIYRRLTLDTLRLDNTDTAAINQSLIDTANSAFFRFVSRNYLSWIAARDNAAPHPIMSPDLLDTAILPLIKAGKRPVLMLLDNLTLDQWIAATPIFTTYFDLTIDSLYTAILPTSTQYCRNSIMAALMPADIATRHPALWVDEKSSHGKNLHEEALLRDWITRRRLHDCTLYYMCATDSASLATLTRDWTTKAATLTVIIVSFTDILAHAAAATPMMRELAPSDSAYRSLLISWMSHSPIPGLLKAIAASGRPLIVTTDHGSIRVNDPVKVAARSDATPSLRYKIGRDVTASHSRAFTIQRPALAAIPASPSASCIIAGTRHFFLYPNDFNNHARTYAGTYQHGGISMQEMLLPLATLTPKTTLAT